MGVFPFEVAEVRDSVEMPGDIEVELTVDIPGRAAYLELTPTPGPRLMGGALLWAEGSVLLEGLPGGFLDLQ
jgi:hypothetical protein